MIMDDELSEAIAKGEVNIHLPGTGQAITRAWHEQRLWALDQHEANALYELEQDDFWRDVYAMARAGIADAELSAQNVEPREALKRIEWKIRNGRNLEPDELAFMADGISHHLAYPKESPWDLGGGKRGRPENTPHPVNYWRDVATVHFYRLLLPALDGRKPVSWEWLALKLRKSDRKTLPPLVDVKRPLMVWSGPTPNPYDARVRELVRAEGLEGVVYVLGHLYRPA